MLSGNKKKIFYNVFGSESYDAKTPYDSVVHVNNIYMKYQNIRLDSIENEQKRRVVETLLFLYPSVVYNLGYEFEFECFLQEAKLWHL